MNKRERNQDNRTIGNKLAFYVQRKFSRKVNVCEKEENFLSELVFPTLFEAAE